MQNTNKILDVIILALTTDQVSFDRTKRCVESYLNTAEEYIDRIIIVESNKDFSNTPFLYDMSSKIKVIIPKVEFNYNQFYNIGLEECGAKYIMGPNNDYVVHEGCIENLIRELEKGEIVSICPVDRTWHRHTEMYLPNSNRLYTGYEVSLHMFGCVFCCKRDVFDTIGLLDERFFFFYQDNDYMECLKYFKLKHGVLTSAHVTHKSGSSNNQAPQRCKYTSENMNSQALILEYKWKRIKETEQYETFKIKE